jgi:molecular chaperone DnaK (HSP70)
MSQLLIGIDLGTTHTVVAYADPETDAQPRIFEVPRLTAPEQLGRRPTLSSVLYAPLSGELAAARDAKPARDAMPPAAVTGPASLASANEWVVGDWAVRRGREVPGRAVFSAKSWLSYAAVDRHAGILPWGTESDVRRISPVDASATILTTVANAWDVAHPRLPLREQSIVLTVPASFDPTARQLTLEAANRAGLNVRLLEEPQAAFYDYLERSSPDTLESLLSRGNDRALALVCDVGGGTTDLTLLEIRRSPSGAPSIDRLAVGRHLLLGGDNMDLALAHRLEPRFSEPGAKLAPHRFAQLMLAARDAKERLLSERSLTSYPVTLAAQGSALVGGTRSVELTAAEVQELIVSGFFPEAPLLPLKPRARMGLSGFGLPYETEPAITRHVAAFLQRHLGDAARIDALLLNGGVFLAPRLVEALTAAVAPLSRPDVITLPQPHPDLAVARGAVVYGMALLGHGLRIGGGSAHGYYVAVEHAAAQAPHAMCIVPRGSREAEAHSAASRVLALTVGTPVRFELYSSDAGPIHAPGELVAIDTDYELVAPLLAQFPAAEPRQVPVVLEGELSPVGTLELACVSTDPGQPERFALVFELRGHESEVGQRRPSEAPKVDKSAARFDEAVEPLLRVFGRGKAEVAPREVKDLFRHLEKTLGPREQWTLELSRKLFDVVGPKLKSRRRSVDHERLYWMLSGYLLRPGFGHPLDRTRTGLLVPLFPEGLAFADEIRGWQQFFIAWRRLAPGLDESDQIRLFDVLLPNVSPSIGRSKKRSAWKPLAEPELLDCVTFLERLPQAQRTQLGEAILERTWTKRDPQLWAALGRVAARVPVYASVHHVIAPKHVEEWLDHLLREKWEELPTAAPAAVQMARITGDRVRDVDDRIRTEVCRRLERLAIDPEQWRALRECLPIEEPERAERFGEQLPVGLKWIEQEGGRP